MPKKTLLTIKGTYCKVNKGLLTENGVYNKVKKAFITVGGVYRPCWSDEDIVYYGRIAGLSEPRGSLVGAMVGDYALFGGGKGYPDEDGDDTFFKTVDTYNASLTKGQTLQLYNIQGVGIAATTLGDNALIGGGYRWWWDGDVSYYEDVNVFNKSLTRSANKSLYIARTNLAATTVGDYALFGGGVTYVEDEYAEYEDDTYYTTVDAFNTSLTRSNPTGLNEGRNLLAATSVGNYAIFGGGYKLYGGTSYADAYDKSLTRTVILSPSFGPYAYAYNAASVGDYAIFAGSNEPIVFDKSLTGRYLTKKHGGSIIASIALKNYALFCTNKFELYSYDESLSESLAAKASGNRGEFAAAAVGDFALFAGGSYYDSIYDKDEYYSYVEAFQYIKGD